MTKNGSTELSYIGAFSTSTVAVAKSGATGTQYLCFNSINFSAASSSSIYKTSAHVRPISRGTCFYIKY